MPAVAYGVALVRRGSRWGDQGWLSRQADAFEVAAYSGRLGERGDDRACGPVLISTTAFAGHHEEDLIIFAIDFAVTEGKEKEDRNYSEMMRKHVLNSEPETLIYEYYFSDDSKNMYLYEV